MSQVRQRGCNIHKEEKDTAEGCEEPRRARLKHSSFARMFSASYQYFEEQITILHPVELNLIDNHKSQIVIIRLYVLCENSNHFDFDLHTIQSKL